MRIGKCKSGCTLGFPSIPASTLDSKTLDSKTSTGLWFFMIPLMNLPEKLDKLCRADRAELWIHRYRLVAD